LCLTQELSEVEELEARGNKLAIQLMWSKLESEERTAEELFQAAEEAKEHAEKHARKAAQTNVFTFNHRKLPRLF
jgi:hypothetical protein